MDDAPLARVFYEVYTTREAHAEHEANEHTRRLLSQVALLTAGVRAEFLGAPTGKVLW